MVGQIFSIKKESEKKNVSVRVNENTADAVAKLRKRIKQIDGIEHTLDEQFDKAISKIVKKANLELDELDEIDRSAADIPSV